MQHSVPENIAPTIPKFLAELHERTPISLNPLRSCSFSGSDVNVDPGPDMGVSYDIDAMNRPKTPPRAKPAPPERTVLAGQDSMPICICGEGVSRWYDGGERGGGTALMICCWRRSSGDMFSLLPRPPSGLKPPKLMVGAGLGWSREAGVRSGGVVGRKEARRLKISLEVEFGIVPRNGVFRVVHGPTVAPQETTEPSRYMFGYS